MKIDRVKFTREFTYHGISEWMGCEAGLDEGEDATTAILQMREKMISTFNAAIAGSINYQENIPVIQNKER